MNKFKVGDKVRVKNIEVDTLSHGYWFMSGMSQYIGKEFTIKSDWGDNLYRCDEASYVWAEDWLEPVEFETIVIYRNDDKTVALDKGTGKKAEAVCSKEDIYDFYTGAKIAFERLISEDNKKEKPKPKLYNGKVVCLTSIGTALTKGRIYEFKDGYSQYDDGGRMPLTYDAVISFEDLNGKMGNIFVEIVE